jgi:valyl-tRNA synthetase
MSLTSLAYPLHDGSGEIVVTTSNVDRILSDIAVAVHPEDPRYKHVYGKFVVHPIDGSLLPIISNELVDMNLGAGAVNITNDPNDFSTGDPRDMIDESDAVMRQISCAHVVVDFLKEKGLYRGTLDHPFMPMSPGISQPNAIF